MDLSIRSAVSLLIFQIDVWDHRSCQSQTKDQWARQTRPTYSLWQPLWPELFLILKPPPRRHLSSFNCFNFTFLLSTHLESCELYSNLLITVWIFRPFVLFYTQFILWTRFSSTQFGPQLPQHLVWLPGIHQALQFSSPPFIHSCSVIQQPAITPHFPTPPSQKKEKLFLDGFALLMTIHRIHSGSIL